MKLRLQDHPALRDKWPPQNGESFSRSFDSALPTSETTLKSVCRVGNENQLSLYFTSDSGEHRCKLRFDSDTVTSKFNELFSANVGSTIQALGLLIVDS